MLPDDTREQFSSREGGLIQVTNITSHTLGVVLWDEAQLEEYVFPMIRKMTRHSGDGEEFIRHRQGQHAARRRADRGRREHVAGANARRSAFAMSSLPPFLPKGSPVELTYEYNANQVLEVAVEASGNQAKVSIERNTGLAPNEVEQR